jgi:UDP-glucose 4-epimerase
METVILRFSHTQDAAELLDEDSFFSGPRFFLRPRIRQQERFGNTAVVDLLRAADPGHPAQVLARNAVGRPFRMHITETRDMAKGVLLGLDHPDATSGTFNLGATEPVDFAELLPRMAAITGLPIVTVDLPGAGVYYHTSNRLIRERLGFESEWTIDRMLDEAARARRDMTA